MRSHEGKEFALWLDHSGNYIRFQEDWDDIYENGVHELDDGREKTKKEKTAAEKEAAKCPKCSHIWPGAADTCPCCGYVRERRNSVTAVPGEMEELAGSGKLKKEKREWYGQFLFVCQDRGYKPGWAANKFKEKFGSYPNGLHADPVPPQPEVAKWLKASHIRFMKSRQRSAAA
jgi:hypothetical protein